MSPDDVPPLAVILVVVLVAAVIGGWAGVAFHRMFNPRRGPDYLETYDAKRSADRRPGRGK